MAALEGFDLSINTGDLVVTEGMVNGVHVAGATLDGAALNDGVAYATVPEAGGALSILNEVTAGRVAVGSCTIASGVCSAPEFTGRGRTIPASA